MHKHGWRAELGESAVLWAEHGDKWLYRFGQLVSTSGSVKLIESGESVTAVSRRLGHASPMETLQTYAHLFADNEDQTVGRLDAAYSALVSSARSKKIGRG